MTPGESQRQAVRRQLVLLLLISPSLCVLPLLAFVAPAGPIRAAIMALTLVISLGLGALIYRANGRLRRLAEEAARAENATHPD